ncbi:lipolytic enzyme, G-D-S-L [Candidatus Vecturithrix granuli]|uniref:Lipolytic enzyme, G-D-S-L n=1 Tax=Vecturithrix granuli TaxID=1499967 RepID=A0A081BYH0_VECG1|nr:lipolytic enzyme, G-D-S-L [Candidatus Vecturithrix granuli]
MKTIVCFGDSNTWGYHPATKERYGRDERWAGVLRNTLGAEYLIIEEGLNGRTTVWDDPIEGYKNGKEYLIPCLETHKPLDLVIIMLGTNDLKKRFSLSAFDIAKGVGVLVSMAQRSETGAGGHAPKVLLLAPPPVAKLSDFAEMFEGSEEKSRKLGKYYRQVAEELGCAFLDTSEVIVSSDVDGIHFDLDEHRKLGEKVAAIVRTLLQ